jgi:peptidoglycan/LPS O-acetylase OafA/YrhL
MTRRIEAGPVLVGLGALLVLVSVFLNWYQPNVTAWEAFEALDLLLTALAVAALVGAVGAIRPEATVIERHWLPAIVAAIAIIVAAQILNPPPSVDGDPDTGAWLALGAAVVMCIGTLLTLGRVSFALTVEGRDTRRRVSAVDARADDPTTAEGPAVTTGRTRPMGGEDA